MSNVLLLTFVGGITLYLLAAFTEVRIAGKRKAPSDRETRVTTLPPFRYVRANDLHFSVAFSGSAALNIEIEKGTKVPAIQYHLQGDTLVIDKFQAPEEDYADVIVTTPRDSLRGIECSQCLVTIVDAVTKSLELKLDHSQVYSQGSYTVHIGTLTVNGLDDSQVILNSTVVGLLDVSLDHSRVDIVGPVTSLRGSIANSSQLGANEILDFVDFRRDASSSLIHRK